MLDFSLHNKGYGAAYPLPFTAGKGGISMGKVIITCLKIAGVVASMILACNGAETGNYLNCGIGITILCLIAATMRRSD